VRIVLAGNVGGEITRVSGTAAGEDDYVIKRRDAHFAWAEASGIQLTNLTHHTDVLGLVDTATAGRVAN
jgi:hypothetical protein